MVRARQHRRRARRTLRLRKDARRPAVRPEAAFDRRALPLARRRARGTLCQTARLRARREAQADVM